MNPAGKIFNYLAVSGLLLSWQSGSPASAEFLPPGFRPLPLGVHALVGGRIVIKPGSELEAGTIIVRDGFIKAVGKDVPIPEDARVWDMKGTTIYAGFIEPYLALNATNPPISTSDVEPISTKTFASGGFKFYGAPGSQTDPGNPGPGYGLGKITPEIRAVQKYSPKEKALTSLRELGFTTAIIAPAKGIVRGTSALVALSDEDPNKAMIKPDVFQHIAFETHDDDGGVYPGSLMGDIAAIRQSFFDAQHYALDHADYAVHPLNRARPEFDPALEALAPALGKKMPVVFEPGSVLMVDRAARVSRELGLDFCVVSCGQEWRRLDLAKATGATFIVPLNFPILPKMPDEDDWEQVTLDQLRAWDWAPENPALLRRQGLEIALTTYGLNDKKDFRKNLRIALDRGLSETDALAGLTTVPAKLCGVESQVGTIEPGKLANLTVVEGKGYFDPEAKVRAVWIDGRIYPAPAEVPKPAKGEELKLETTATNAPPKQKAAEKMDPKKEQLRELQRTRVAHSPMEGRGPLPLPATNPGLPLPGWTESARTPTNIVFRGATVWLCDEKGTVITNGWLWVKDGKIVGAGLISVPLFPEMLMIDARDLSITPGIIDCHSHTAILGNVNETGLPSTAMVRISDVVNSETENLHEQLAGGVTTVNLLHGSANPIGGQNCVIKLRDGASPEELIFSNAPPGIKFALGENVKQSNWGEKFVTRFPQTRMGVRTFIQNRFIAAQEYLDKREDYRKMASTSASGTRAPAETAMPVPPGRDLELEAIGEVLQGKRWIHCHAYRQDEMLMLLRLMQGFGVQIGTFQHVLEGYKIADELAAGNVGASAFSDWWAYKFEVYDAIPFDGSLMQDRGVCVSFNSDSSELARRLYLEAAKAVKYGGTPEIDALKFVTLNPAKQLRIDKYVGSLEPGKDADFVIWSKSPLDSGTVCLQTWIDGRKYFDRSLNVERTARLKKEREDLLAKAKKMAKLSGGGDDKGDGDKGETFFRISLEHQFDGRDRHCLDDE
jgi:imidazolonepropionase-like amidohydrolase